MLRMAFLFLAVGMACSAIAQDTGSLRISADGNSLVSIVVARTADDRTRQAAEQLGNYLGKITRARFSVQPGDDTAGIVVGTVHDFPDLAGTLPHAPEDHERETYLLRTTSHRLSVIGTTGLAVEHAVWDLLYRVGYRQFFPGSTWEVVPQVPDLSIKVDVIKRPDYLTRSIWYGYGPWDYAAEPYKDWCRKNRATKGIELETGHIYELILAKHRDLFKSHPEYLGLVDGERTSDKFCISNSDLRQLVVDHALGHFLKQPHSDSISVEPSDGLGWCECADCVKLGSPSDRAVLLANQVASTVERQYPGKRFGMYAYGGHVSPPTTRVHPRIVVSIATAFGSAGLSLDDLMSGWQSRGATLGIREYLSVHPWDRDLPGAARGSNLEYLAQTIPQFHQKGARFFSAESSDNWGPNGLGYYLAARMLWDVKSADPGEITLLRTDFLERAFGPASEPMGRFYSLIDGANRPLLSDDLIGRMYRTLDEARHLVAGEIDVRKRIDELVLYTHYVELWFHYSLVAGEARQSAFERLIRFAYRIRKTMMVHVLGLYRDLPTRDKTVHVPSDAEWEVPEGQNPWKSSEPITDSELEVMLNNGIATHPLLDFSPISYSDDLVPVTPLKLPEVEPGQYGPYFRDECDLQTWIESPPGELSFTVKAGLIYTRLGNARFSLFPRNELQGQSVAKIEVTCDQQMHDVSLASPIRGLQRLSLSDSGGGTAVTWPAGTPLTIRSDPKSPAKLHGRWTLYFYVPRGTTVIGGFADGSGELHDSKGQLVHTFKGTPGYFSLPVAPQQDGCLWKFHHCNGRRLLMTTPPYLARSEKELLLPAEVVKKDSQ